jgi:Ca2+-binding RTX toxin-like protein
VATLVSGLGGAAGYGEQSFRTSSYTGNLDDGSTQINITSVFGADGINLYGTAYTSIYLNTNGLITFNSAQASYTPTALTSLGQPNIAPFWTDIDISKGGEIYWDLDPSTGKVTITWLNVRAYSGPGTNSFQVVLTSLGGGDVGIEYIYGSVGFTNGGFGQATVGMSNGTSSQILLEGSGDGGFLSTYANNDFDVEQPLGVYAMAFDGGQPFLGDGIVDGTAGDDLIDLAYTGDPNGDRIDHLDATGYAGTSGNDDYIRAGLGNDTVYAGLGNDQVYGGGGNDVIYGGQGNDLIHGEAGNDSIDGGSGNDTIYGGDGNDTIFGGADAAAVTYTPSYTKITTATQTVTGSSGRPDFSVRTVSNDNDLTTGSNGSITGFRLGNGDSTETHTHTASSQVSGGQIRFNAINSNETLTITLDGVVQNLNTALANGTVSFDGASRYAINGAGQIIRINGGSNTATVGTLTINVPHTSAALSVTGTTTGGSAGLYYEYHVNTQPNNVAAETGGNDEIHGGDGADYIDGGNGNDTLYGDAGNDTILGGAGNDQIYGGAGVDSMVGGTGSDTFTLNWNESAGDVIDGSEDADNSDVDVLIINGRAKILYDTNPENGTIRWANGETTTFSNIESITQVPCFTPGTLIETKSGPVPVELLRVGHKVLTRDNGFQRIRWIGRRQLVRADLAANPALQPVLIRKGALGGGLPSADMRVSPQHRMLLTGARADLLFGETEVLAAALHLVGQPGVERAPCDSVTYLHLMFDAHEIILADGAWTESFHPGERSLSGLEAGQRAELFAIFPELRFPEACRGFAAARLSLKAHEVSVLLAA